MQQKSPSKTVCIGILLALLLNVTPVTAEDGAALRFANIFSDNMVLQQQKPLRLWGWAKPSAPLTVTIAENNRQTLSVAAPKANHKPPAAHQPDNYRQHLVSIQYMEKNPPPFKTRTQQVQADNKGFWQVKFEPLQASFQPKMLIVSDGNDSVSLKNILVGEVWVCSGQSNMEYAVVADTEWDMEGQCADYPAVRYCSIARNSSPQPLKDLASKPTWVSLTPDNPQLSRTSGVSYYFAVRLHRYLKVPVGIIHNAWGGTTAETWTSRPTLQKLPPLKKLLDYWDQKLASWPEKKQNLLAEYEQKVKEAKAKGKKPPKPPRLNNPAQSRNLPGGCYNAMLAPISKLAVRGALFFQGENNAYGQWSTYRYSFPKLIEDWRAAFSDDQLPFGIISLFGFGPSARDKEPELDMLPGGFWYAAIRDVHFRTFCSTPNTGLIVTFDVGDADNIHPHRKRTVAERSARWALAKVYDKPVAHTGPIYRSLRRQGNKIILYFHLDPLADPNGPWWVSYPITRAGEYRGFVIAGQDKHFYPAKAHRLRNEHALEVWSEHVSDPVAVRYGWSGFPDGNVIGIQHLPAHPFRTDHWPLLQQPPYDRQARQQWNAQLNKLRQKATKWLWQRKLQEINRLLAEFQNNTSKLFKEKTKDLWQGKVKDAQNLISELLDELTKN